jgi:hypothetical protein
MSDASTNWMIEQYVEEASAPGFLSSFFQSPRMNFHDSEHVEFDVIRDDEEIAVPIQGINSGARENEVTVYTNKNFTPPVYNEELNVSAYNLIKRQPGEDPFARPDFGLAALRETFRGARKLERKIRRGIEVQASQVLQTGVLTLVDAAGATVYTLDFQPKATHLVTAGTAWAVNGSTGTPLIDIDNLGRVVRRDGKRNPDTLIFGQSARQRFMANTEVKAQLDNLRMDVGMIMPQAQLDTGATHFGRFKIGSYAYDLWEYDGSFVHPQTGETTDFVDTNKVIMLARGARRDLTFGSIPLLGDPDPRVMPFLPPRITSVERQLALTMNAYITQDRQALKVRMGTRPLCIPTAIDCHACLTVA